MKNSLILLVFVSLNLYVSAQSRGTQDSRLQQERVQAGKEKPSSVLQSANKNVLLPMPNLALPIAPIRLTPGENTLDLRDYTLTPEAVTKVSINGKVIPNKGRYFVVNAPLMKPIEVLKLSSNMEELEIPVFNTSKLPFNFQYKASNTKVQSVFIAASFNGWSNVNTPLTKDAKGNWTVQLMLDPGDYAYRIWEDGKEMLDVNNPLKKDNGLGGENSYFTTQGMDNAPAFLTSEMIEGKNIIVHSHGKMDEVIVFFNNKQINTIETKANVIKITLPNEPSEGFLRVFGIAGNQRTNDLLIPIHQGVGLLNERFLPRQDQHAQIMYFMMVDRFADGRRENNLPTPDPSIHPKANNMGGDLTGIKGKIDQSYFSQLGVNTLWISPISQNVEGAWGLWDKGVNSKFSAYHGYWPLSLTKIDKRFGTNQDFDSLISTAHRRQLNVVLDYVAHHVHEEHPLIKTKKGWTTPLYLPDGTMNTERWDDHRLTTWFDTFLPTFDFAKPEVVSALSDTALYWVKKFPIDGFRHDATKHIQTEFWSELTYKIKKERNQVPLFQIGETYGNPDLISSYVSSGLLDAQFDFNLYDAALDAFAKDQTNFSNLQRVLTESFTHYGHHHLMGNITGNQDRARFISYADGSIKFDEDAKLAGWTREIKNRGSVGYRKMEQLMAFIMTTPGVPCIYYGDEIGMPGGNDPDNRRMMQFDQLNNEQRRLKSAVTRLTHLRSQHMALTYGDTYVLRNDDVFAYVRKYFGDMVLVVFDKTDRSPKDSVWIELEVMPEWAMKNFEGEMGSVFKSENGRWKVNLSGKGYDVFIPRSARVDKKPMAKPVPYNQDSQRPTPDSDKIQPKSGNTSPKKIKAAESQPVNPKKPDEQ